MDERKAKDGGAVWKQYTTLRFLWAQVIRVDVARDPEFQKFLIESLRTVHLENSELKGLDQSAPDEQLIEEYLARVEPVLPEIRRKIQSLETEAGFSAYVREQAKAHALTQMQLGLIDTYLHVHTPAEIERLRAARKQLEIEFSRIPPAARNGQRDIQQ